MYKHQDTTKHDRKMRQLASEEVLREKGAKNALARLAQEQALNAACKVFEGVLAKEARAEKAEKNRIALVARNPVVECHRFDEFSKTVVAVHVPFAAMPWLYQQKIVAALMAQKGEA